MKTDKYKNPRFKIKSLLIIFISSFLLLLLKTPTLAKTYVNNSIDIEVSPKRRGYEYGEEVEVVVKVSNKNRYGKLYYKVVDVYTGGGFLASKVDEYKEVDTFGTSEIEINLRDKYYTPTSDRVRGRNAYGMTEKEYEEFIRYRVEKEAGERAKTSSFESDKEEVIGKANRVAKGIVLLSIIIIIVAVIIIIFIWFIIRSRGSGYKVIVLFISLSLIGTIINSKKTCAKDIYEEKVHYEKTIQTKVNYSNFTCTVDVKVEYYFINQIAPITDLELDTDNDTLPDYLEVLYLTDINNEDTDGDGLSDGIEVFRTNTDPLRADTDNDGIRDSDEDFDNDGLTNIDEKNYGTDYENPDTDFDGLSDYDEIRGVKSKDNLSTYITDPLSDDTDGDGLRDDIELKLNLNPLSKKTDGIMNDKERKIYQEIGKDELSNEIKEMSIPVSFYGEVKGLISENVSVHISNNSYFNQIRSIVGEPIVIDTTYGANDGLKIRFDISKYKSIRERLQVCKIEDGKIVFIERTYVMDKELYADCSSGEYFLIDSNKYIEDLNLFIK
ncbi:MAG: hypothetical protein IKP66_04670 [Lachnospiraceae bacterium]|nr:hypothetical protein [Lachnospiraceae bacterium]